jgi:hypothetical protein
MRPFWLEPWFFFLPFVAFAAGMLLFIRARLRGKIAPLAEALDGGQGELTGPVAPKLAGRRKGRETAFILRPGGKNTPPKFFIQIACHRPMSFAIYRENAGTKVAKGLHLIKDVEIGDPELDGKLLFSCREPEPFIHWMGSGEVRGAVGDLLLRQDVDRLELGNAALRAVQVRYHASDLERSRIESVLDAMETLVRSLEGGS